MKVAIYGNQANDDSVSYIQNLFVKLEKLNIQALVYQPFYEILKQNVKIPSGFKIFKEYENIKGNVDCMLSIGGDGTFLETISLIRDSEIPVLGINTGRLGFLASVAKEDIDSAIDLLLQKKYTLDKRGLLRLETPGKLFGKFNYALNEMTILKKDSSAMITIHAYVNGEFLNSYWADGLIVATPTGSTAYSLSSGGPIVVPDSENFIITPIASHNLNVRPIIVSDKNTITLKVEGRSKNYLVSLDSRSEIIDSSTELTLKKENFKINFIKLKTHNFFNTIRNKLLWGIDRRNY